jgi:hypothetical protein
VSRSIACLVLTLTACRTQPPGPTSAAGLAAELVEAGCVVASPTLAASIQAEEASDAAPPWLQCLAQGGSVSACGAPCSGDP